VRDNPAPKVHCTVAQGIALGDGCHGRISAVPRINIRSRSRIYTLDHIVSNYGPKATRFDLRLSPESLMRTSISQIRRITLTSHKPPSPHDLREEPLARKNFAYDIFYRQPPTFGHWSPMPLNEIKAAMRHFSEPAAHKPKQQTHFRPQGHAAPRAKKPKTLTPPDLRPSTFDFQPPSQHASSSLLHPGGLTSRYHVAAKQRRP
jgi:hypothetical protein